MERQIEGRKEKIKSKEGQKDKGPIRKAYNRNLRDNSGLFRPIFKTRG